MMEVALQVLVGGLCWGAEGALSKYKDRTLRYGNLGL